MPATGQPATAELAFEPGTGRIDARQAVLAEEQVALERAWILTAAVTERHDHVGTSGVRLPRL